MIAKIKEFVGDVSKEMKKVSWPTRAQLKESTTIVVVTTLIFTAFIYLIDWVMNLAIGFVF
ncbi:MAG: preprotein translocase subunit SecE [Ignavibacteria bacterium]|nr:preprotein translocase subunit SecE [Ignavibacteria bacterium]